MQTMTFIDHIREPQQLLLVWQGPEGTSRTRHTVGELTREPGETVRLRYLTDTEEFRAAENEGFLSFPAFRKTRQTYSLGVIETFMRRLPPRSRGDYAEYLKQFRLKPQAPISDFALLGYTGAKLPSDGFSLIDPLVDVTSPCEVMLEVAGVRYRQSAVTTPVKLHDAISFQPEPDNPYDPHAVAIYAKERKIGYVPRQQAAAINEMAKNQMVHARIERLNGGTQQPMIYLFTRLAQKQIGTVPTRLQM